MRLEGLCCACGELEVVAVAPGLDTAPQGNVFFLAKERPDQAWCEACWNRLWRPEK